jgi:GTPase SAR1 and related small G proteins
MNIPGTKQNEGPYDFMVKLLILGDSAVGKSALMCKFCDNNFSTSHIATIGTFSGRIFSSH